GGGPHRPPPPRRHRSRRSARYTPGSPRTARGAFLIIQVSNASPARAPRGARRALAPPSHRVPFIGTVPARYRRIGEPRALVTPSPSCLQSSPYDTPHRAPPSSLLAVATGKWYAVPHSGFCVCPARTSPL